jgi:thiamine-phosphate pyrophosphorylase
MTDLGVRPEGLSELLNLCFEARPGSVAIVLRDRELSIRRRLALGEQLRSATRASGQLLMVADRLDLLLALEADGLHIGSAGLLPSRVRPSVAWLSRAGHNLKELPPEELESLDAVLISPVFAPLKGKSALGLDGLSQKCAELRQSVSGASPLVYALGGVNEGNASQALLAGCWGVAGISIFLDQERRRKLLRATGTYRSDLG